MALIMLRWNYISLLFILFVLLYNECFVYYIVLLQCQWPQLSNVYEKSLKVMLLADTHLLGSRDGHWFDKLRREWQMERAFKASMVIHDPNVVFFLGDIFDEGKWCSDSEFQYHVDRFGHMFDVSKHTNRFVVVGNHDIGFHYMTNENKLRRFERNFETKSVRMVTISGVNFVLINSVAMEGDRCSMCREADEQLSSVHREILCKQGLLIDCEAYNTLPYSPPILLQHFPLFRINDENCTGPDSAPPKEKLVNMIPKYDCLSKEISNKLLTMLQPRLVISGHTHNFCYLHHNFTPEFTLPSFSWRYKNNPSFMLLSVTPTEYQISKCYLPQETTVIYTYIFFLFIFIWIFFPRNILKSSVIKSK